MLSKNKTCVGRGGGGDRQGKNYNLYNIKVTQQNSSYSKLGFGTISQAKQIYCSVAVTMHLGMVTKSAKKNFFGVQSSPLLHPLFCFVSFLPYKKLAQGHGVGECYSKFYSLFTTYTTMGFEQFRLHCFWPYVS